MASTRPLALAGSRLALALTVTALLSGSTAPAGGKSSPTFIPSARAFNLSTPADAPTGRLPPGAGLAVPAALGDGGLGLRAGPVPVPLGLQMPSLEVSASVVGVGITPRNVMDAPMGPAGDPVWQQAFWYRGSAAPGAPSTAVIAGHVNDPLGRPAVFAHLDRLRPGDPILVLDTRDGRDVRFSVTGSMTYSLAQAADPAVLTDIYGAGPVAGTSPQPSADGLSHLTLITCAGTFRNGTHDQRLVVYATRSA